MGTASTHSNEQKSTVMAHVTRYDIDSLFRRQLHGWELLRCNYAALENVKTREFAIGQARFRVQFNPARIISSAAKVDTQSIKQRRCFLCRRNRPNEQEGLPWSDDYVILANPYPIFPRHLTIPTLEHIPQRISGRIANMMRLAADMEDFVVFYNGPCCGASAPDHAHFQAVNKGFMPYDQDMKLNGSTTQVAACNGATLGMVTNLARTAFAIQASSINGGTEMFERLYNAMPIPSDKSEPMLNILCQATTKGQWRIDVFPRRKHRPACYYAAGTDNILISPASVDLGGVFITPLEKDFKKITAANIKNILDEVCIDANDAALIIKRMKQ